MIQTVKRIVPMPQAAIAPLEAHIQDEILAIVNGDALRLFYQQGVSPKVQEGWLVSRRLAHCQSMVRFLLCAYGDSYPHLSQTAGLSVTTLRKIIAGTTNPAEKTYQRLLSNTCLHQTGLATAITDFCLFSTRVVHRHTNYPAQGLSFDVASTCLLRGHIQENKEKKYVIAA